MTFAGFKFSGGSCCCCKTIIILAIYDESEFVYYPSGDVTFNADKINWETLIDDNPDWTIRAGILRPRDDALDIQPLGSTLPKDTDRAVVDKVSIPAAIPRVTEAQILSMFELIRTREKEICGRVPDFLQFCLDNSGSITVAEYAAELAAAKSWIGTNYPGIEILPDINGAGGERWVEDITTGAQSIIDANP